MPESHWRDGVLIARAQHLVAFVFRQATPGAEALMEYQRMLAALGGDGALCANVFGPALTAFSCASSFAVRVEED
jgi:hypothetical protein